MKSLCLSFLALFAISAQQGGVPQKAPALSGTKWINRDDKAFDWKDRVGKVTVVHFWTFGCSNCKANLPAYDRVYAKFKPKGVELIGVHTPELEVEKKEENVREAVKKFGLAYPILIDTDGANWTRWNLQYWPTVFVLDKRGQLVFKWEGELAWKGSNGEQQMNAAIESALRS